MISYISRNFESVLLLAILLLLAMSSVVNLGSTGALLFLLLLFITSIKSPRSGFVILIMLHYAPNWCLHVPSIYIITTAIVALFNWRNIFNSNGYRKLGRLLPIFALFVFVRFLPFAWVDDMVWYNYYMQYIILSFIHAIICCNLINSEVDVKFAMKWWGFIGATAAVLGFFHFFFSDIVYAKEIMHDVEGVLEDGSIGDGYAIWVRWIWAGAEPNYHGLYLLFPFAITTWQFFKNNSVGSAIVWALCFLGIFGTYSRSSLLCSFVILSILILYSKVNRKGRIVALIIAGLVSILLLFPEFLDRISTIRDNISNEGGSGRFSIWQKSMALFYDNPIFGAGTGQAVTKAYVSHNTFVQVLAENGIIGFISFICIYLYPLRKSTQLLKVEPVFFAALVGVMLNMCTVSCYVYRLDVSLMVLLFSYIYFKSQNITPTI